MKKGKYFVNQGINSVGVMMRIHRYENHVKNVGKFVYNINL